MPWYPWMVVLSTLVSMGSGTKYLGIMGGGTKYLGIHGWWY